MHSAESLSVSADVMQLPANRPTHLVRGVGKASAFFTEDDDWQGVKLWLQARVQVTRVAGDVNQ